MPNAADVSVIFTDTDGTQTLLTTAQYSVSLNAPGVGQLWSTGGRIVYPISGTPLANNTSLTIFRTVPDVQDVTIRNQGNFYPTVTEQALDLLCMIIQQVSGRTGQILGNWATGVQYNYGDVVQDGINGNDTQNFYMCVVANTSNVWQSDLAAGYWRLALNIEGINDAVTDAEAAATAAAASAVSAAGSSASAGTSATSALNSASAAATSATSASNSAATASTSAATATTQAGNAATSASSASSSASSASTSAIAAAASETNAATSATAASTSATAAASSATSAAASAAQAAGSLLGTSTTSNTVGTGSKTFTTQAGLALGVGGFVTIAETSSPANYMHGQVTSYSGTTLIVNVLDDGGTGTLSDWTITTSSPQGPAGSGSGTVNSATAGQLAYYAGSGTTVSGNVNATMSTGALTLGQAGSVQGSLVLSNATSGTTTILPAATGGGTITMPSGTGTLISASSTTTLTNKTITASSNVLGGVTMTLGSDAQGDIYYRNSSGVLTRLANGGANTVLHGSGTVPAYSAVVEGDITLSDVTTNNVTSTAHGFTPKSPADATKFLNGAATPGYAAVKDSDLSLTDITTNNVSTSKHGFCPKLSNVSTQFLNGVGAFSTPSGSALQPQMTVFTSSGTFTTSANITTNTVFEFTITGGGAGGGGVATGASGRSGSGGGAGATAIYNISGLTPSTGYTVTIGAAGTAGNSSGSSGGAGGATSIVIGITTITGGGGNNGSGSSGSSTLLGGTGGTASNGTINITGGDGGNGIFISANGSGGNGGTSYFGGGGIGGVNSAGGAGAAYGSGGGGGNNNGGGSFAGGAGKAGILIVKWLE